MLSSARPVVGAPHTASRPGDGFRLVDVGQRALAWPRGMLTEVIDALLTLCQALFG